MSLINDDFKKVFSSVFVALMIMSCSDSFGVSASAAASTPSMSPWPTLTLPAIPTLPSSGTVYHVSASAGSDAYAGTSAQPFKTIQKGLTVLQAGQVLYIHAGTYSFSGSMILSANGSASAWYYVWAYPGEAMPVLDFFGESANSNGINIYGSYWYIKGLEVTKAGKTGIRVGGPAYLGSCNIIEQCVTHDNGDSGLYIGTSKSYTNEGNQSAYNQIINCDSYRNYDPGGSTGPGGNADGFSCKLAPGLGNRFKGCRSWENSDDGWDLYMANYAVTIEDCWTWHNGDPVTFGYTGASWGGNGQGFKVGGGSASKTGEFVSHGLHVLKNCIAFDIKYPSTTANRGFDRNNNMAGVTMYNCLSFNNGVGYYFGTNPDPGYGCHILKNCVVFDCSLSTNLSSATVQTNNSWNASTGVTVSSADYRSLDVNLAKAAREADGSLPNNDFAKLSSSSPLKGKGIDVGDGVCDLGPKR
jgi:pectate disaccharide-lyase